ncbi:MAG: hypothetical protein AAF678_05625 [Pseudomonadota bacterium]
MISGAFLHEAAMRVLALFGTRSDTLVQRWAGTGIKDDPILMADVIEICGLFNPMFDPETGEVYSPHEMAFAAGRQAAGLELLARLEMDQETLRAAAKEIRDETHEPSGSFGRADRTRLGTE